MPEYTRRYLLRVCVIAPLGLLTGCIGSGQDPIDIRVANEDTETHTITVTVTDGFAPNSETESLPSEETATLPDMIPLLDSDFTFTIEVDIDGTVVSTTRHRFSDISPGERPVSLIITDSEAVSVDIPQLSVTPTS